MKTYSKTPAPDEEVETIPCPVCGKTHFDRKWEISGSRFVTCLSCGLLLQNPRPQHTSLALRYDAEYCAYEIQNQESFFNLMLLGLHDAAFFENIVPTLPSFRRILDVGCATGRLLRYFKEKGWETAGVEICEESAEYGNREYGVNITVASMGEFEFPDESFSTVHASHLIEHVDNPSLLVAEVSRVLMPGGVFVCVTPTTDGFQARLFNSSWRSAIPDHMTLFSLRTLKRLLGNASLHVELVRTWGGLAAGTAPLWIKKPIDYLAKRWGFGDVLLVVARKPRE